MPDKKVKLEIHPIIGYICVFMSLLAITVISIINIGQMSANIAATDSLLVDPLEELVHFTLPYEIVRAATRDLARAERSEDNTHLSTTLLYNFAQMKKSAANYKQFLLDNAESSDLDFSKELGLITEISDILDQYGSIVEKKLIPASKANLKEEAYDIIENELDSLGTALRANIDLLLDANDEISAQFVAKSDDIYKRMLALYIGMMVIVAVLAVVVTQRSIKARKLEKAKETAELERQKAESANAAKSDFLAKMSHEIRTPMNAVLGMSELILREETSNVVREHALGVKQAGSNLLAIINDILDFSKIESGKMEVVAAEYEFASLINDVISIVRMRVLDKPILFVTDIDSRLPAKLIGDEVRTRQILLNLLGNAIKYTQDGHIKLTAIAKETDSGELLLSFSIEDTGVGIRDEDVVKLFGDFVQLDKQINKNVVGTGLGLAITRSLARAMGGDVTVSSIYGEGSVFTATLRQKPATDAVIASVDTPDYKHVLVFEIRKVYADSVMWSLGNLGVKCELASTAVMFEYMVRAGDYSMIFVSTLLFDETVNTLEHLGVTAKLVLLAEYGETVVSPDVRVIAMPVHPISIANILNGKADSGYYRKDDDRVNYIAPDARLLIVDDIRTNLRVAEGLMSPLGAAIDTCLSGAEAIELIQQNDYDIVFMDHMMPVMDGVETTAAIRGLPGEKYKNLVVIALTANAISGMKDMFISNGFNDYLAKPIETDKLFDIINRWIPKEKRVMKLINSDIATSGEKEITAPEITIEGIDTVKAIKFMGGSYDAYIDVLELYCKDVEERLSLLKTIPQNEDELKLFTTQVHALKSASRSIGADKVSEMSADMETYGNNADVEAIAKNLGAFRKELTLLLIAVTKALPVKQKNTSTGVLSVADYQKLKDALTAKNVIETDNILESLGQNQYDTKTTEAMLQLANSVLMFDFDGALAALENSRGGFQNI